MLNAAIGNDTLRFFVGICIVLLECCFAVTFARIPLPPRQRLPWQFEICPFIRRGSARVRLMLVRFQSSFDGNREPYGTVNVTVVIAL
jgi:hypothetical protein